MKTRTLRVMGVTAAWVIALILVLGIISYSVFGVINPFASAYGIIRLMVSDEPIVTLQNEPKVLIAKPGEQANARFTAYMEGLGYVERKDEQMGSILCYERDGQKQRILASPGGYFATWKWE